MPGNDGAYRPAPGDRIDCGRGVMAKPLAMAEGKVIDSIGANHMGGIPIAAGIVAIRVIEVLPVVRCGCGLSRTAPGAVVAIVVGHALLIGIRNLGFEAVVISLLKYS